MNGLRVATFNASLNRNADGELIDDLATPNDPQARQVAEIVQRVDPDILLVNEFDYDAGGQAADLFRDNYLEESQNGQAPVEYPYVYVAASNTGVPSGLDLDNSGSVEGPNDAYGFGFFPGQYAFAVFSKHPIETEAVRTFQDFRWADMPGARLPDDASTPAPGDYYSPEELEAFRLSSKNHVDVPVSVDGEIVHVLASHPTPPVFDGPEDRNGARNADEIRFFSDYVTPGRAGYIYDDQGRAGGLGAGERFVVMGDQNADPFDGDSLDEAATQLTGNPLIDVSETPASEGGIEDSARDGGVNLEHDGNPSTDTADFSEPPGNLRVDYVLPSKAGLAITGSGVFWPEGGEPGAELVGASDHRLAYVDLAVEGRPGQGQDRTRVDGIEFLGRNSFATGRQFEGTEVGGLSGLVYDDARGVYYAISDDRSEIDPARFYTLDIELGGAAPSGLTAAVLDVTTLTGADGAPFAAGSIDAEGIALTSRDTLYISSEGSVSDGVDPFVAEFSLDGESVREFEIPEKFLPTSDEPSGIRDNLAFESLTLTPDERYLWTATENALVQDGPQASVDDGSASRVLVFDTETGEPVRENLFEVDAVPEAPVPPDAFATNGLVELAALDNTGSLLAVERAFSTGVGNTVRLFESRAQGATDIASFDSLADEEGEVLPVDQPLTKELLLDLGELGIRLDNTEAAALGPVLPDGRQSLILASDNNFSDTQRTQFLAFALDTEVLPAGEAEIETQSVLRYGDPRNPDFSREADPDDPAIYVNPIDAARSTVITANKDAGLRVYDLDGNEVQAVSPDGVRFNNVDVVYGFDNGEATVDLAVASDRENDTLAIYEIDPADGRLRDVTAPELQDESFSVFGEDDGEQTAYALASWRSPGTGADYVFTTQREGNLVAQLELEPTADGRVTADLARTIELPVPTGDPEDSQAEGIVVDRQSDDLYVATEDNVGILKYGAEPGSGPSFDTVASIFEPYLTPDIEGLTLYYGEGGEGYLIASSQGDSSFAVFERGGDNAYLGSFVLGEGGEIDASQETDGLDVVNVPLGSRFPQGLLVTQDGSNEAQVVGQEPEDGEIQNFNVNFKYTGWEEIAGLFEPPLAVEPDGYDPRNPTAAAIDLA